MRRLVGILLVFRVGIGGDIVFIVVFLRFIVGFNE